VTVTVIIDIGPPIAVDPATKKIPMTMIVTTTFMTKLITVKKIPWSITATTKTKEETGIGKDTMNIMTTKLMMITETAREEDVVLPIPAIGRHVVLEVRYHRQRTRRVHPRAGIVYLVGIRILRAEEVTAQAPRNIGTSSKTLWVGSVMIIMTTMAAATMTVWGMKEKWVCRRSSIRNLLVDLRLGMAIPDQWDPIRIRLRVLQQLTVTITDNDDGTLITMTHQKVIIVQAEIMIVHLHRPVHTIIEDSLRTRHGQCHMKDLVAPSGTIDDVRVLLRLGIVRAQEVAPKHRHRNIPHDVVQGISWEEEEDTEITETTRRHLLVHLVDVPDGEVV
jgi:hypothetical protein